MDKMVFACSNGVVAIGDDKKVFSATLCDGRKKLQSFPEKNKVIFWHFPFMRGMQYFFCGIFAFFSALVLAHDVCGGQSKIKQSDLKKYYTKKLIYLAVVVAVAVIYAVFVMGFLPGKLGWLIVGYAGSTILRNFVICALKIALFCIFLLFLRVFPEMSELFRFNRGADKAMMSGSFAKNKKAKVPANPLNFLNFLVFVFILHNIVITLVGASFGFWFNLFFHIAVLIGCSSVAFEILNLLCLCKWSLVKNLAWVTCVFVYAKPSTTHIETASIALTELNLLKSQKGREFMTEQNHAFSVVYNEVRSKLLAAGVNDKSDADWLIATVLGKNRAEIKLVSSVTDKQYQDIIKATNRRAKGESLDNIFGFTEFYGLRFEVNKKVLTPRMETEILVEQVLKSVKDFKEPAILDLGTGSGAIAVAIAKNCPDAVVSAVDVSKMALATAEGNAKKNGVKVEFLHSNLFDNLKRKRKFDIIVSNPPYIPTSDLKKLDKNVRECDPILALDGGEDGLDFYRAILSKVGKRLKANGMLFFEVGKGQAAAVRKLMKEGGFEVKTIKDYNKIERVICGKLR